MILPELLAILMVVAVCCLLFAGYPVALTLGGVSLAFAAIGHFAGVMSFTDGLRVVKRRGEAMQAAADASPSGMVSVIGAEPANADDARRSLDDGPTSGARL